MNRVRLQHVLGTVLDGAAWFMAFAMIGFTDREDFGGILAAIAIGGAAVSAGLTRLIARATSKAARALDAHVAVGDEGPAAATYLLPVVRHLGEGYAFARAAADVSKATGEPDLRRRVQRVSDARALVHLAAYAMFAVRFAGYVEAARVIAFALGVGGVFLTAIVGRMLLAPLEREAERREQGRTLAAVGNEEPVAIPTSNLAAEVEQRR